jgi:predicted nucleotidyltransferase
MPPAETRAVVDWAASDRRRGALQAELDRIVAALPALGVRRAVLFGSLARGEVGITSDLDLILVVDSPEPFTERCARFYRELAPRVALDLLVYTPDELEAMGASLFLPRRSVLRTRVAPSPWPSRCWTRSSGAWCRAVEIPDGYGLPAVPA